MYHTLAGNIVSAWTLRFIANGGYIPGKVLVLTMLNFIITHVDGERKTTAAVVQHLSVFCLCTAMCKSTGCEVPISSLELQGRAAKSYVWEPPF